MVQILHLNSRHDHADAREHPARARDRHQGIARILVIECKLNSGRRDLPEALVHQTKANYAGVRAEAVARLGEEFRFSCFKYVLG